MPAITESLRSPLWDKESTVDFHGTVGTSINNKSLRFMVNHLIPDISEDILKPMLSSERNAATMNKTLSLTDQLIQCCYIPGKGQNNCIKGDMHRLQGNGGVTATQRNTGFPRLNQINAAKWGKHFHVFLSPTPLFFRVYLECRKLSFLFLALQSVHSQPTACGRGSEMSCFSSIVRIS